MALREGPSPGQHSGCGRLESDRSQLLGQAGGDWGQLTQRGRRSRREFRSSFKSVDWRVCRLIVSDDHSTRLRAAEALSFLVPWQRCQFHLSRMLSDMPADPTNVPPSPLTFETSSMPRLEAKLRRCRARVEQSRPQPGARPIGWRPICREGFTVHVLTFEAGGASRTNNGLENLNRQFAGVPGSRYLSNQSALRLITAVRGDSRRLADRETDLSLVDFKLTGESDLRSLSVKLQKNSCLASSVAYSTSITCKVSLQALNLDSL